jgi:dephospho-CoA kinase
VSKTKPSIPENTATHLITNKLLVGLTGGIGSGKTSVANGFAQLGATVIDADAIAHSLTIPGGAAIPAIQSAFGNDMIAADGAMDRAKMRSLIFSDTAQKQRLESIIHPLIRAEVARQTSTATGLYIMYVVPLLVETGHWKLSRILVVDCAESLQLERVIQRDGLAESLVSAIMKQQATRAQRLAVATEVIQNEGTFEALIPEIERLHNLYVELSLSNQTEYL